MKKTYIDAFDHIEKVDGLEFFAPSDTEPHDILEREQLRHVIELALKSINERGTTKGNNIRTRDIKMVRMSYGLDIPQPLTHYHIGVIFDLSTNRVSQIIKRTLTRLKMPETNVNIKDLYEYLKEV
tara:strand:+ start:1147 stop:1524 length:378 start_codon:yes stop_codon:yes gene_type:complete